MEKILRGVMRYRHSTREQMVKEFQKVRDNPKVSTFFLISNCVIKILHALLYACMEKYEQKNHLLNKTLKFIQSYSRI